MSLSTTPLEEASNEERVLAAALGLLASHGEAALRVTTVAQIAGVSVGTIYTHFDSRDGLVEAAFAEQYRCQLGTHLKPFDRVIGPNCTREDLLMSLRQSADLDSASEQVAARRIRCEIMGASHYRPKLAEAISRENYDIAQIELAAARQAQELGLIDQSLDAEALVALVQIVLFGLVLCDSDIDEYMQPSNFADSIVRLAEAFFPLPS
jgi:AcrR family transcriptional regulator